MRNYSIEENTEDHTYTVYMIEDGAVVRKVSGVRDKDLAESQGQNFVGQLLTETA